MCVCSLMRVFLFTVDADEIKRLGKRFRKLDLDGSGALSVDEFMSLPELQQNPLVQRVIDIFDTDGNGEVDFKGEYTHTSKPYCSCRLCRPEGSFCFKYSNFTYFQFHPLPTIKI